MREGRDTGSVGGLPVGMKFDRKQGLELQKFISSVAEHLLRILKPWDFMLMFSAPCSYHRMAVAVEDCEFEIRDQYAWRFTRRSQFKAVSMDYFVTRKKASRRQKRRVPSNAWGRKTLQLRSQFESILCAQKLRDVAFVAT